MAIVVAGALWGMAGLRVVRQFERGVVLRFGRVHAEVRAPGLTRSLAPVAALARAVSKLPYLPSTAQWVEAVSHPAIMDTAKAKAELGWKPRHTAIESLRSTIR